MFCIGDRVLFTSSSHKDGASIENQLQGAYQWEKSLEKFATRFDTNEWPEKPFCLAWTSAKPQIAPSACCVGLHALMSNCGAEPSGDLAFTRFSLRDDRYDV